jgi:zinc protease
MSGSFNISAPYRTRLKNGLTVLIHRNATAPVVAINTYVKAGYFDETDDIIGIAHVLEHMFFKGTARRGVGEIAKATKRVGGYLNAHTIYDHTSYYTVLPSSGFAEGIDIQADAYANSVIDAGELAKELEVIIQEAKRKDDNAGAVTTETLYELLHDRHRIRRWRIGRENSLRTFTREQVLGFYRNFYTPSNTILVIAGDVDIDDAMRRVEELYGHLPDREPVRSPGPKEEPYLGYRYRELQGDVAQTQVAFGWQTVPSLHDDTPALDMVASVLSAGRASRLYRAVRERKLAGSVGAYNYSPKELGVFVANAEAEPATAVEAARAIWAQVQAVRNGDVTNDEIHRAQQLFVSRWARRLETMEGYAAHLAEWESLGGYELAEKYYDAYMRVTPDDVTRVAQQYLAPERTGAIAYRPKQVAPIAQDSVAFQQLLEAETVEPLEKHVEPVAVTIVTSTKATFLREEAGVRVYKASNEIPILVASRPGAITYMGIYATGGATDELPIHAGLTALAARSAVKGTESRSAYQIAETSELLGGSVSASVGGESFGWSISVPTANAGAALELLGDVVQNATLLPNAIETERAALLSDIAQLRDDMYRYPMRLLAEAAFGDHPYGIPTSGTESSLRAITGDDIREWYRRRMQCAPFVIAIVGDVDSDTIADHAARAFSGLTYEEHPPLAPPVWPSRVVQRVQPRDKAQTALALGFPSPSRTDTNRFAVHLLASIASGLGGRFFDELRDKQSLAYTVHAFASTYRLAGMFISYIATSPGQEQVAREGLLREFEKLQNAPVSEDELQRAKTYTLGMHDIRQERGGAVLSDIVDAWLFGNGLHELNEFRSRVQAVSAEQILQLAQRYFDPERRVEGIIRGGTAAVFIQRP